MRLHVTLREEPLDGSDLQVVVRCGVWNNDRIRGTFPNSTREAYEELLERHPELRARLAARYGTEFAVVSVFARPGEAGLVPDAVGVRRSASVAGYPQPSQQVRQVPRGGHRLAQVGRLRGPAY